MKNQKTQALYAVLLIAVLAVGAYAYSGWVNQMKDDEQTTVTPTPTASVSASPTASATPTATTTPTATPVASKYKTLKSTFGFSFEYNKDWVFGKSGSSEGLPHVSYTSMTANAKEENVYDSSVDSVTVSATGYPKGSYTLDAASKEEAADTNKTRVNLTDVTVGTAKYPAKRYDDGGGMFGFEVTYLLVINDIAMHIQVMQDEALAKPTADVQHILDTLTFD